MRAIQSSGRASATAIGSAFWRATAFGTSSPSTTERYVRIANAMRNATVFESGGSMNPESSGSPMAPSRIPETVIPTWTVLMNRTGSSIRRSARSRTDAALLRALLEPAPPRGDERVLRRDEDRVRENEKEDDDDAERCAHRSDRAGNTGKPRSRQAKTPTRGVGTRRVLVVHAQAAV